MCGIVGYIGEQNSVPILLNGLSKLEYRGYDSAGIALFDDSSLKVIKCKGRLSNLEERVSLKNYYSNIGIGHTRWATHGEPNDINSHPHISSSGNISIVHNGIIENYMKIKSYLQRNGFVFTTDTDTEVIAHLLEHLYNGNLIETLMNTLKELEGSYALGVISKDHPNEFVAARKDSPLIVGLSDSGNFIASDIPAILEYTRDVYILEDKEIVHLTKNDVTIYNEHNEKVKKEIFKVTWDAVSAEKGGYEHFMMKEMYEEPKAIVDTIRPRIIDNQVILNNINISPEYLKEIEKIYIVACGTAYHSGVIGKYLFESLARIPVEVDIASEFRYREPIISEKNLVIIISQSGETLDTLFALREAKKRGAKTLSIVNVLGSSIARDSDEVFYTQAGPEISVASTKAYNTQLSALYLLALDFAKKVNKINDELYKNTILEMQKLPSIIEAILSNKEVIQKFAASHYNAKSIFFIGRGLDYALSMEGSLKLKELSYIHSEAYAGGELKHGTIALIEEGTLVVCPMTQDMLYEKMISNIREVKARGAVVLAITQEYNENIHEVADEVVLLPKVSPLLAPIVAVTPLQLFAYYMAVEKGCDVDKPRNLAKSVTVE